MYIYIYIIYLLYTITRCISIYIYIYCVYNRQILVFLLFQSQANNVELPVLLRYNMRQAALPVTVEAYSGAAIVPGSADATLCRQSLMLACSTLVDAAVASLRACQLSPPQTISKGLTIYEGFSEGSRKVSRMQPK